MPVPMLRTKPLPTVPALEEFMDAAANEVLQLKQGTLQVANAEYLPQLYELLSGLNPKPGDHELVGLLQKAAGGALDDPFADAEHYAENLPVDGVYVELLLARAEAGSYDARDRVRSLYRPATADSPRNRQILNELANPANRELDARARRLNQTL